MILLLILVFLLYKRVLSLDGTQQVVGYHWCTFVSDCGLFPPNYALEVLVHVNFFPQFKNNLRTESVGQERCYIMTAKHEFMLFPSLHQFSSPQGWALVRWSQLRLRSVSGWQKASAVPGAQHLGPGRLMGIIIAKGFFFYHYNFVPWHVWMAGFFLSF